MTMWLTGSPDAGIMPVAHTVADQLRRAGHRVAVLDVKDVQRARLTAEVLARNGVIVLASSTVPPFTNGADVVRHRHDRSGTQFLHVHMSMPAAISDTSGAARPADDPDLVIRTLDHSAGLSASLLLRLLSEKRFVEGTPEGPF
ncbi:adenylyl-sulfate kinase [Streptomyces rubrogriseus]|uniref:adenylyl-sulfate kinase n=1 Tax=Streptomyces rubrogriseus TaxID=194673 RepID=UPI00370017CC